MKHRKLLDDDQGSLAVEFGLMIPLFALLLSGIFYFGVALNRQLTLTHAAREGVRIYALTGDAGAAEARAVAVAGPGFDALSVSASGNCDPDNPTNPPVDAVVQASSPIVLQLASLGDADLDITIDLTGRAVMRCGG